MTAVVAGEFKIWDDTNQFKVWDTFVDEQNASGFSPEFTSVTWELRKSLPSVEFPQIAVYKNHKWFKRNQT